jgi:hypothetical protein
MTSGRRIRLCDARHNSVNMAQSNVEPLCDPAQDLASWTIFQSVNTDRQTVSFCTSLFVASM